MTPVGVAVLLPDRAEAVEGALGAVPAAVLVGEGGDLEVGALAVGVGVDGAVAFEAVEHGARGQHPAPLRMLGRVAGALVVQGDGGAQRPADVLQQIGAAVPVEAGADVAAGVAEQVVGIAVAVEVPDVGLGPPELVAAVVAGVDDQEGSPEAQGDGDGEVEAEIAADGGALLHRLLAAGR